MAGSGTGLWVELAGIGTGIVLGLVAAALMPVYTDDGRWYSYAAIPCALLWVAVVGTRLWFAYAANHDIRVPVGTWHSPKIASGTSLHVCLRDQRWTSR